MIIGCRFIQGSPGVDDRRGFPHERHTIMTKQSYSRTFLLCCLAGFFCAFSTLQAQLEIEPRSHRVVEAKEIQKAGYDQFRLTLNYLMPDVFPKTAEGWSGKMSEFAIYVDKKRCEPEYLDDLDPRQVKRITVWEKGWDITPMDFPNLAPSRFVVSIETI